MLHFYVPINHSKAVEMVTNDEEIVYSTLCMVETNMAMKDYWESHVLITTRSIIFTKGKFNNPLHLYYLPWSAIKMVGRAKFDSSTYSFKLRRDVDLETEEEFLVRSQEFKTFIKPIREGGKKYWKTQFQSRRERMTEVQRIMEKFLNNQKKES